MSSQNSHLKVLLSPTRSGSFFAPFRTRSANPDGFDSKMKTWINAIEEWVINSKRLKISLNDIHATFTSENGIRPDKECIRLVLSEMRRRSLVIPYKTLKDSPIWSPSTTNSTQSSLLDSYINPNGPIGWGLKKFLYEPASWAITTIARTTFNDGQPYSDLTDLSITDNMVFVSLKSLNTMSQNILMELVRISKAERQACFEWHVLVDLMNPIISTIVGSVDNKEQSDILDIIIEYLAINKSVAIKNDNDTKLIKISNTDESRDNDVIITQKDVAVARLLRAKEVLTTDMDKYLDQARIAKREAMRAYERKELGKAQSYLRSSKRFDGCAEQRLSQLNNVEDLLDRLETTESNRMILDAYKEGADALAKANTKLDSNMKILDDLYDVTAEASQLNSEMNQMMESFSRANDASMLNISMNELETELNQLMITSENPSVAQNESHTTENEANKTFEITSRDEANFVKSDEDKEIERALASLNVIAGEKLNIENTKKINVNPL